MISIRHIPIAAFATAAALAAALGNLAGQTQQNPCAGPEHHQFEFWVGEWDVARVSNGQIVARSRITSTLNGCAIHEDYLTQQGYAGYSYSAYDRQTGQWHQTWVDTGGLVLKLDGGIEDGSMVMRGTTINAQGVEMMNEVRWTPHPDGSVQQTWRQSPDGGKTWTTAFDGMYSKKVEGAGGV